MASDIKKEFIAERMAEMVKLGVEDGSDNFNAIKQVLEDVWDEVYTQASADLYEG